MPAPFLAAGMGPAMLMPGSDLRTSAAPAGQSKGAGVRQQHEDMHRLDSTGVSAHGTRNSFLCQHIDPQQLPTTDIQMWLCLNANSRPQNQRVWQAQAVQK